MPKILCGKREHLAGHDLVQAVNARDAVADADDRANFIDRDGLFVVLDLLAQNFADFVCFDICHSAHAYALLVGRSFSGATRAS